MSVIICWLKSLSKSPPLPRATRVSASSARAVSAAIRAEASRSTWSEPAVRALSRSPWTTTQDSIVQPSISAAAPMATTSPTLSSRWVRRVRYRDASTRPAIVTSSSGTASHGKAAPPDRSPDSRLRSDLYRPCAAGSSWVRINPDASRR